MANLIIDKEANVEFSKVTSQNLIKISFFQFPKSFHLLYTKNKPFYIIDFFNISGSLEA